MAALEGAEAARATATGMAAVTAALLGQLQGRRPRRRGAGAVRLLPLRGRGAPAALRRRLDAGRRHRPRRSGARRCGRTPRPSSWKARPIPTLEVHRHRGGRQDRARGRRDAGRRQRVRDAAAARSPLELGADMRRLFGHQAHRRPGPLPRRRHPRLARSSSTTTSTLFSGRPARRCRRSTPGCCSRAWRRWRCGCAQQTETAATDRRRARRASEGRRG